MRVEESIVIGRACGEVFDFIAVRRNDAAWIGTVEESEWLDPGEEVAVGRRGRMVLKLFGRRRPTIDEVTAYEPGRRLAHRTVEGSFKLNTACVTADEGTGCRTTVVAETDRLPGGPIRKLAAPFIAAGLRRGFKADLVRLKNLLETNGSQAPAVREQNEQR
jgi:hypothetical protein